MQPQSSRTNGDGERHGSSGERNRGVKHLPYTELMDRKTKGLCFRCGERYTPLHQCAEVLRLIILGDDEVLNQGGKVIAMELQEGEEGTTVGLNSRMLSGLLEGNRVHNALPNPLHLAGSVKGMSVTILVDTGGQSQFHLSSNGGKSAPFGRPDQGDECKAGKWRACHGHREE